MRACFQLDGHDHEIWLSRGPGGYRLHRDGDEGGTDVALHGGSSASPPPEGEVAGAKRLTEGATAGVGGATPDRGSAATRPSPPARENDIGGGDQVLVFGRQREAVAVAVEGDDVHIHLDGRSYTLRYLDPVRRHGADTAGAAGSEARAPMPGTAVSVLVAEGQAVAAGEGLLVIESMKLETVIRAARAGTVKAVLVRQGQSFARDQVLIALEEEG